MSANDQKEDHTKVSCTFSSKILAVTDFQNHELKCVSSRTCRWCKITFKNRGSLATHTKYKHAPQTTSNTKEKITCDACKKIFMAEIYLRFHIRQEQFNLKTKITVRDTKKINQVWFERVYNTRDIV